MSGAGLAARETIGGHHHEAAGLVGSLSQIARAMTRRSRIRRVMLIDARELAALRRRAAAAGNVAATAWQAGREDALCELSVPARPACRDRHGIRLAAGRTPGGAR